MAQASPYGVPTKSVAEIIDLGTAPLVPVEQQALKYLITQLDAVSPRVRAAFLAHIDQLV